MGDHRASRRVGGARARSIRGRRSGRRAERRVRGGRSGGAVRSGARAQARDARPANLPPSPPPRVPRGLDDRISRAQKNQPPRGCHVSPRRPGRESRTCDAGSAARLTIAVRTALAPVCMKRCIAVFVVGATPSAIEAGSGARRGCGFEKQDGFVSASRKRARVPTF